ncbi:hypothetical protein FQZ97_1197160 [compost metagenome]
MRARARVHADIEHITPDQTAGWVNDHVVADRRALRVKALEDAQRAVVLETGGGFVVLECQVERETGVPGHGESVRGAMN